MTLTCCNLKLEVPGRTLCRDFSVEFASGEMWAVLGRNGTGKSTLMHALAGLARPAAGTVRLDGRPVCSGNERARARVLGVLLQIEDGTFWGTVREYVLLGRFPHAAGRLGYSRDDVEQTHAALDAVGMLQAAEQKYVSLSGGERQRVRIAQVLAQQPRVYLLDEPLQHLDLAYQAHVLELLTTRVKHARETAIMVLHEPLWIGRACTHALLLSGNGEVECGPAEVVLTRDRLERAYGLRLRELRHGEGRAFVPDV